MKALKVFVAVAISIALQGCANTGYTGPTPAEQAVLDDATCVVDWKTKRGTGEYTQCRNTLMQNTNQQAMIANQRAALQAQRAAAISQALTPPPAPVYVPPPVYRSPTINCTSMGMGNAVHTNCY